MVTGHLLDTKQALGVTLPLAAFDRALVCQQGRGLSAEHTQRAQGCIFHAVAGMFAVRLSDSEDSTWRKELTIASNTLRSCNGSGSLGSLKGHYKTGIPST